MRWSRAVRRGITLVMPSLLVLALHQGWQVETAGAGPTPLPDLAVTKTDSADPVVGGNPLTYTVVVTNIGQASAGSQSTPIKIVDVPDNDYFYTAFAIVPTGSCFLSGGNPNPGGILRCEVETLAPSDSVTITIEGFMATSVAATVQNAALVDLPLSQIVETTEVANNHTLEETTVLAPTPTPTPTSTPTATATPTDTPTPPPVGGISRDPDARPMPSEAQGSPGSTAGIGLGIVGGVSMTALALAAFV